MPQHESSASFCLGSSHELKSQSHLHQSSCMQSVTCGEDRSIGATCSAYRLGDCNGHVRLKMDGTMKMRMVGRQFVGR